MLFVVMTLVLLLVVSWQLHMISAWEEIYKFKQQKWAYKKTLVWLTLFWYKSAAKAAVECLGTDGLLLNQNIDAIFAIFSAGTPQTYSLFCLSPRCLSNQFRLNHNPLPSFTSPLPFLPLPSLLFFCNFAFPLDVCVMTWPSSDRHYTHNCLQRERRRHECHTD